MAKRTVLLAADPERRAALVPLFRDLGYDVVEVEPTADLSVAARDAAADLVLAPAESVARADGGSDLAGTSPVAAQLRLAVDRAAASESPALITGPRGASFARIAGAIHARSTRRKGSFVALACAALPPGLAAPELEGRDGVAGRVARAAGGTLFLEEVGALDAQAQASVMRASDGEARVIASSTRDLGALVAEDRFRADLLARLSESTVVVPPLRARLEDLPALVERYLATHRRAMGGTTPTIAQAALARLAAHAWPGDTGELETVLDHALALGRGDPIEAEDLPLGDKPLDESELPADRSYFKASVAALERDLITTALRDAGGNRSRAAELLGIYRRLLYAKIKEYGLEGQPKIPTR